MSHTQKKTFFLAGVVAATFFTAVGCEPATPARGGYAPQTSRLGINAAGDTLYVALADHDQVRAVDAKTGDTLTSVDVVGHPHRLTVLRDGKVAVTARYGGTLSVLDMNKGEVISTTEVGSDPFGVVEIGDELVVAVAGEGDLAVVKNGRVDRRITLDSDDPRGLAVTEGKLVVSHFSAGKLSVVDVDAGRVRSEIPMKLRSPLRSFFTPNQIDQITVDPSDAAVIVAPHVECNNDPAQFGAGSTDFVGVSAAVYYNSGPTGFPAVVPGVSRADVDVDVVISEDNSDEVQSGFVAEPAGPASPIINPLNRVLLDTTLINGPTAVAMADDGALELVVALGSGNVVIRRSVVAKGEDSILGVVDDVGVGAEAIVLSPDGGTAYVFNGFDQSISSFAVPETNSKATRFDDGAKGDDDVNFDFVTERNAPMQHIELASHFTVAEQVLSPEVVRGRELFHSVDQRMTQNGAISCASCHPGGGDDGTTWSFAEGPRQSPALWGGILGTEPFHWDMQVDDMADISRVTIIGRMGGSGLGRSDMNAIGAFLDQIPAPAARTTAGAVDESISRGADLFAAIGCTQCHAGNDETDNQAHDVGTGTGFAARETANVFATPPLKGLVHTAPYLHDGSARSVRDVINKLVVTSQMIGVDNNGTKFDGSQLTPENIDDLVAYLEAL